MAVEPVVVSYSEIDKSRQCLFAHELAYKERWQEPTMGEALAKGILWHSVLEAHYRALKAIQDQEGGGLAFTDKGKAKFVFEAVQPFLIDERSGKQSEHQELIEWMYKGYLECWGLDDQWKIVAVEHAPIVPLPDPRGRKSRFHLKLKIDLVIKNRTTNQVWIVDHKSGRDLPNGKMLEIADQFGLYTWALRQLGRPVFGSIHNATRTQRNKDQAKNPQLPQDRNRRTPMYRTDPELDTIALEAYRQVRLAYSIPLGEAPRSPNEDTCRWRCSFTEPCLMARKGLDIHTMLTDFGFQQDYTRH